MNKNAFFLLMTLITPLGFAGCSESSSPTYCEITFKNYDSSILFYTSIKYGEDAVYQGETPIRPSSNEFTYVFSGWDKPLKSIKTDTTFIAQYEQFDRLYNITWSVNGEDTVEQYKYNEMPTFKGDTSKSSDTQYTYTFSGWSPEVVKVTGDVTYVAQYSTTVNHYTVTWNVDGNITTEDYAYGEIPTFKGSTAKSADAQYTYTFSGWSPEVVKVTGDANYSAKYSSTTNKYLIRWLDWNGDLLDSQNIEYGESPEYHGITPSRDSDDNYDYDFDCWTPEISSVTGAVDYVATYSCYRNHFNVFWLDWDGTELEKDEHIAKGSIPSFDGYAPTKESDFQYNYSFAGWSPEPASIESDATYYAQYEQIEHHMVFNINQSGESVKLTEYTGNDAEVNIPSTISGKRVSGIGESAFAGNTCLKNVVINEHDTVNYGYALESNAFKGCSSLESINLPSKATSLPIGLFEDCASLKTISLPITLTQITSSFVGCISLESINLHEGMQKIRHNSFKGCTSLTEITLPSTLTELGPSAFENCSNLSVVRFQGTMDYYKTKIIKGNYIFDGTKVAKIQCSDGNIELGI